MAKKSRTKGISYEREIVNALAAEGINAERVPLSGGMGGSFGSQDVQLSINGEIVQFECKRRAGGFKMLYRWMDDADGLFLRADREQTLVVIPFETFAELVKRCAMGFRT